MREGEIENIYKYSMYRKTQRRTHWERERERKTQEDTRKA
jgi:hypothetical protein